MMKRQHNLYRVGAESGIRVYFVPATKIIKARLLLLVCNVAIVPIGSTKKKK